MYTPPGVPRSRSLTRLTIRVGLEHFGQSVLLLVSMTFLRSPVLAIFAIMLVLPGTNIATRALNVLSVTFSGKQNQSSDTSRQDYPGLVHGRNRLEKNCDRGSPSSLHDLLSTASAALSWIGALYQDWCRGSTLNPVQSQEWLKELYRELFPNPFQCLFPDPLPKGYQPKEEPELEQPDCLSETGPSPRLRPARPLRATGVLAALPVYSRLFLVADRLMRLPV
jgi:hypothetical protein